MTLTLTRNKKIVGKTDFPMINTKSIDNPDAKWKEHLKYPYFFDVEKDEQFIFINNTFKKGSSKPL